MAPPVKGTELIWSRCLGIHAIESRTGSASRIQRAIVDVVGHTTVNTIGHTIIQARIRRTIVQTVIDTIVQTIIESRIGDTIAVV